MRVALLLCWVSMAGAQTLPDLLARVAEEAAVFRQVAPQIVAEERLTQHGLKAPPRFHPRIGDAALKPLAPTTQTHEIVSEYSFGTLREDGGSLHEFRQVVSVDGRPVRSAKAARESLALGLSSSSDKERKRMLENFAKHGLTTAAVDFGQLLLLFTKPQLSNYQFDLRGRERIGADEVQVIEYKQTAGTERMLIIQGRQAIHQPIQGRIYARLSDGLPLRITLTQSRTQGGQTFREEASVDYVQTPHGFLAPAAVTHRGFAAGEQMVEDSFRYGPFRKFTADAEIKFDVAPEPVK